MWEWGLVHSIGYDSLEGDLLGGVVFGGEGMVSGEGKAQPDCHDPKSGTNFHVERLSRSSLKDGFFPNLGGAHKRSAHAKIWCPYGIAKFTKWGFDVRGVNKCWFELL
jgi:hypothetical protein